MKSYIVRLVERKRSRQSWEPCEYVGTYQAHSPVQALTLAGADPYLSAVARTNGKRATRLEAVPA